MFSYCMKCGLIQKKSKNCICPVCEYELNDVPKEYLTEQGNLFKSQDVRKEFVKNVIETSEVYDAELAKNKENILSQKREVHKASVEEKVKKYNETKVVLKCPVCGSSNLSKISNVGKVVKVTAFGILGAGDIGKIRRCNSCGHKF